METKVYYKLLRDICAPGLQFYHAGTRLTKEQWLDAGVGFKEEDFGPYNGWFTVVESPVAEVDVCVHIILRAMQIQHTNSPYTLRSIEEALRAREQSEGDVAKAYGLRVAADKVRELIAMHSDPSEDFIRSEVERLWRKEHESQR